VLYLGGSVHALHSSDYPLPAAFNQAFDASSRIAFEVDPKALVTSSRGLEKAGEYAKNDSLKKHVDPRTYDYLRRLFALMHVPEAKFARYRPWFIVLVLTSPAMQGASNELGVEHYIERRAAANHKPVVGLESSQEHARIFTGLTDKESETLLLVTLIPSTEHIDLAAAWRRGDADALARMLHNDYREFPAFGRRIIEQRNRNWLPKIEGYLDSGSVYFVVVGAGHMGGPDGIVALLRGHGCRVEQL
jgi:uncharacterized protein YbaP (TraB family)